MLPSIGWRSLTSSAMHSIRLMCAKLQTQSLCRRPSALWGSRCCVSSQCVAINFLKAYFTFFVPSLHHIRPENYANYFNPFSLSFAVKPISTSIVHKPKQLVTESQITLSCEVEGSVPDTDVKWTQNNRVFERGTVSEQLFHSSLARLFVCSLAV